MKFSDAWIFQSNMVVRILKRLFTLVVLAWLLTFLAYQVRSPLRVDVGDNDQQFVRGFHYSPDEKPVPARWTAGDGKIILRDTALNVPLTVLVRASAYRWADQIYTTTVTLNSHRIGMIDRAGWRTWRFEVNDASLLGTHEMVIGLQSQVFVPSSLSPDYADDRELGIFVDWIEIQPHWNGRLILPPSHQLIFVALLAGGMYLAGSRCFRPLGILSSSWQCNHRCGYHCFLPSDGKST